MGLGFCLVWGFYVIFVAHEAHMERAKRDIGFVVVWGGLGFCRRLWSAKRDMIRGLWCKNGPEPWPWPLIYI